MVDIKYCYLFIGNSITTKSLIMLLLQMTSWHRTGSTCSGVLCGNGFCAPLSFRLDGFIQCNDGADEAKEIGTACDTSHTCCPCVNYVSDSTCSVTSGVGVCQCRSGYAAVGTTSCVLRSIGDSCSVDLDCRDAIPASACIDSQCACQFAYQLSGSSCTAIVCGAAYILNSAGNGCRARQIGVDTCSHNDHCRSVPNAVCVQTQCQCAPGYDVTSGGFSCFRLELGSSCSYSGCHVSVENSACVSGTCICVTGYFWDGNKCKRVHLGNPCKSNYDCWPVATSNSVCDYSTGTCRCRLDNVRYGDICTPLDSIPKPSNSTTQSTTPVTTSTASSQTSENGYSIGSSEVSQTAHVIVGVVVVAAVIIISTVTSILIYKYCKFKKNRQLKPSGDERYSEETAFKSRMARIHSQLGSDPGEGHHTMTSPSHAPPNLTLV